MALSFIGTLTCRIVGHKYRSDPDGLLYGTSGLHRSSLSTGRHDIAQVVCTRCGEEGYFVPLKENL